MGNAAETLVIILAVVLSIFLILVVIALIKVIQLIKQLKAISTKAEKLVSNAGSVSDILKFTAGPAAVIKMLSNIAQTVVKHRNKGGK